MLLTKRQHAQGFRRAILELDNRCGVAAAFIRRVQLETPELRGAHSHTLSWLQFPNLAKELADLSEIRWIVVSFRNTPTIINPLQVHLVGRFLDANMDHI